MLCCAVWCDVLCCAALPCFYVVLCCVGWCGVLWCGALLSCVCSVVLFCVVFCCVVFHYVLLLRFAVVWVLDAHLPTECRESHRICFVELE